MFSEEDHNSVIADRDFRDRLMIVLYWQKNWLLVAG
jgi:hypothetical protein